MDVEKSNIATISAADLLLARAERLIKSPDSSLRNLRAAILPLFGIQWNKQIICAITTNRLNSLLQMLRNRNLDSGTYDKLANFWQDAFHISTAHPPEWLAWLPLIQRFRLNDRFSWTTLYDTLPFLNMKGYLSPEDLAVLTSSVFESIFAGTKCLKELRALWGAARAVFTKNANEDFLPSSTLFFSSDTFVTAVKEASKRAKTDTPALCHEVKSFGLKPSFNKLGPAAKIAQLRRRNLPQQKLTRFITERSQLNLLKQIKGSLPSIASAIRCYTSFCELINVRPFPPTEETVIQWSCVFNDTATYRNYIGHLRSACFFYRLEVSWLTPAVRHIARGLAKCQNKSFRFPNFIRSALVARIIDFDGFDSQFAQVAYLSFLFSLRVPSETLAIRRAFSDDPVSEHIPQSEKALIKICTIEGVPYLVLKLSHRKNLVYGCILRRPCFCSLGSQRATALCPVHAFWPLVIDRVHSGSLLFPNVTRRNVNRIIKAVFRKLSVPHAERYSSHGFRRGSAQELKETGSPWTVVAGAGRWMSASVLSYVDTSADVECDMANLLANPLLSESDDELA